MSVTIGADARTKDGRVGRVIGMVEVEPGRLRALCRFRPEDEPAYEQFHDVEELSPAGPPPKCGRCDGCGRIADTEEGEPWTSWLELPLQSSAAVLMGIVNPIPCPDCGGTGGAA